MVAMKFGILSTANIAVKVCKALHDSGVAVPYCVGSRTLEKAKDFAEQNKIEKAYGSYEEVLLDQNVEAVYVPVPTATKTEWALKVAKSKKHLLLDKPMANSQDLQHIIQTCKENNVHFMDNTMFVHNKRTKLMIALLKENQFGPVQRVNTSFSIYCPGDNIRFSEKLEPYGAIGDMAWYTTKAILISFNWELPQKVFCTSSWLGNVPDSCSGIMWFSGNRTASFDASLKQCLRQHWEIVFNEAAIHMSDFVLPYKCEPVVFPDMVKHYTEKTNYVIQHNNGQRDEITIAEDCVQVNELVKTFVRDIHAFKSGAPISDDWTSQSIKNQLVVDAIFQSAKQGKEITL